MLYFVNMSIYLKMFTYTSGANIYAQIMTLTFTLTLVCIIQMRISHFITTNIYLIQELCM